MIRNILSSNGKSLGITDILPQYGEDYRLSVMDGTVDYRTIPLGAYDLFKQGSSKQDYLADIEKIKTMGFNTYQLSFSWTRLFPTGEERRPDAKVLAFYESIIDALLENDIEPIVSLSHFDFPLHLYEKYGAWKSRQMIALYEKYCEAVLTHFKEKVTYWITFKEMSALPYLPFLGAGLHFDSTENQEQQIWLAAHHQLIASANVVKLGQTINPTFQFGSLITINSDSHQENHSATDALGHELNRRKNYIFTDVQTKGHYPNHFLRYIERNQLDLGITEEDVFALREGVVDFIAFSHYAAENIQDLFTNKYVRKNVETCLAQPVLLRIAMSELYERYHKPLLVIETCSEVSDHPQLAKNIQDNVQEIIKSVEIDGIELLGYTPFSWSDVNI